MDLEQLQALVTQGESETLQFKRSSSTRREVMQALCGMLNTRGGRVLFGVEPTGRIVGQQVSDHTLEEIAQEVRNIEPVVLPQIDRIPVRPGVFVISVLTSTGANRPYRYRGQAYGRVGNTCSEIGPDECDRLVLERFHGERRWETEPADGWTVADLDAAEITRTIDEAIRRGRGDEPGTREPADLVRSLNLMRDGKLLRAAVVLFGKRQRVEAEFPQCMLRVAKFKGADKTEFIDNRQFHGNTFRLMSQAEQFLRDNLPVAGRVVPNLFERKDDPLFPPVALREALANAFCHRDYAIGGGSVAVGIYQDRLEITSSGELHFGLTAESLFQPHDSRPWNPRLAQVFFRRGLIEQWGRGTLKMAELAAKAGQPRPEIEDGGGCVLVRFRPSRYIPPAQVDHNLPERQRRLLKVIGRAERPLSLREVMAALDSPPPTNTVKDDLQMLKTLELVVPSGRGPGARWRLSVPG